MALQPLMKIEVADTYLHNFNFPVNLIYITLRENTFIDDLEGNLKSDNGIKFIHDI